MIATAHPQIRQTVGGKDGTARSAVPQFSKGVA